MSCLIFNYALYGNSTEGYYAPWLAVYVGVAFLIYTTADNCDGKQARKNGTGSVMGMMFDHGLDAATAIVMNVVISRMIQIGPGVPPILAIQCTLVPCYFIALEEYYVGYMDLPMFSGPEDMSLAVIFGCWFSAYMGAGEFWQEMVKLPFISEFFGLPSLKRSTYFMWVIYIV